MMKYIFSALVVLLLVFTACTGTQAPAQQNDEQQNDNAPALAQQETQTEEEQEEPQAQAMEENQAGSTSAVSEGLEELQSFLMKKPTLTYMVDYDVATTASGQSTASQMTYYIKGTEKMRIDMTAEGMELRTYILGQVINSCNKATGSWMCFETEMQTGSADNLQKDVEQNAAKYKVTKLPGRTIAGAATDCFRVEAEQGNVDYCFTANAVPLYIKTWGTASGQAFSSEMTATEYSTSVSDAEFELPAQGQAMPTGGFPSGFDPSQFT